MNSKQVKSHPLYTRITVACSYGKRNCGKFYFPSYYGYDTVKPISLTAHWNQWKKDCVALLKADKIDECVKLLNSGDAQQNRYGYDWERTQSFIISHYNTFLSNELGYQVYTCRDPRLS